jgi:hypothetical protein
MEVAKKKRNINANGLSLKKYLATVDTTSESFMYSHPPNFAGEPL